MTREDLNDALRDTLLQLRGDLMRNAGGYAPQYAQPQYAPSWPQQAPQQWAPPPVEVAEPPPGSWQNAPMLVEDDYEPRNAGQWQNAAEANDARNAGAWMNAPEAA